MELLRGLTENNDVRSSCLDALAINTVGLGYTLTVEEGFEQKVSDPTQDIQQATAHLEALARRDRRLNPNGPSLSELLVAVKRDEEEVGWGAMEVSRDRRDGQISGFFHVPSWRLRRRRERDGYMLLKADGSIEEDTRFYNFGEKVNYSRQGKPAGTLVKGRRWNTNEVLVFKLYTSESRDYGMPRDVALAIEYAGDKKAAEANVSFFDSSGTPPTVIFVQGVEDKDGQGKVTFRVPRETSERIASTLKSDAGHRHRVAIIPVPPGTTTQQVQLGEFSDRDVGFTNFRADNTRRIISSFRLQPIFVPAVADEGKYTAEVQRAITLEQTFDPEQRRYEDTLGETILKELGYSHLRLRLKRLAVEDDKTRRDSADMMAEAESITRREYRKAHGYGPLPEAEKGSEPGRGPGPARMERPDRRPRPSPRAPRTATRRTTRAGRRTASAGAPTPSVTRRFWKPREAARLRPLPRNLKEASCRPSTCSTTCSRRC